MEDVNFHRRRPPGFWEHLFSAAAGKVTLPLPTHPGGCGGIGCTRTPTGSARHHPTGVPVLLRGNCTPPNLQKVLCWSSSRGPYKAALPSRSAVSRWEPGFQRQKRPSPGAKVIIARMFEGVMCLLWSLS